MQKFVLNLPHEAVVGRSLNLARVDCATTVRSELGPSNDQRSKTEDAVVNSAGDVGLPQLQTYI